MEYIIGAVLAVVFVTAVALFLVLCLFNLIVWVLFMFSPEPPKLPRHAAPRDWTPAHEAPTDIEKEEL